MEPTLYELLNLPLNADPRAIENAYLTRLRQVMYGSEATQVAAEVLQLTRAYSVLVEAGRRAAYDHALDYLAMARDGYDATCQITLTATEARQGTIRTISYHRPDGQPYDIAVIVPPGCRHGDRIRVAGAGGPSLDSMRRGDLVVELVVKGC